MNKFCIVGDLNVFQMKVWHTVIDLYTNLPFKKYSRSRSSFVLIFLIVLQNFLTRSGHSSDINSELKCPSQSQMFSIPTSTHIREIIDGDE